jgi:hypothetical protein
MKRWIMVAFICLVAANAFAETAAFQASLTPDIAIHPKDTRIEGVTLNIWGENPQSALAVGLVNGSTGDSAGLSWGVLNYADKYTGVGLGFVNFAKTDFTGLQFGLFNYAADFKGLQHGTVNIADTSALGVQWGMVNYTGKLTGLQLGTVNFAKTADSGIQIGLINIIAQNKWFTEFPNELATGMIFVNWRFQ